MAKTLQFRRDTTANLAAVTGAVGEIFIDTTKDTVVVMDGATAGGFPLQGELTAGSGIDITAGTISATGGGSSYGDANVGTYLTTYTGNIGNVSTTANVVTTQYFIGNGSQLTGIVSGGGGSSYGDANVGTYLTTYTGNIGNVKTTANVVTTQYFIGNGSQLTGITSSYTLPTASSTTLGGVKIPAVGTSAISITSGNISVADATLSQKGVIRGLVGSSIALGQNTGGSQGTYGIAIGHTAGYLNQGIYGVAIGVEAGRWGQLPNAVAIGQGAGDTSQGAYSIAIGYQAGYNNQPDNTIILNASGTNVNGVPNQTNSFYVTPVRSAVTSQSVYYDSATKEISYGKGSIAGVEITITSPSAGQVISYGNITMPVENTYTNYTTQYPGETELPDAVNYSITNDVSDADNLLLTGTFPLSFYSKFTVGQQFKYKLTYWPEDIYEVTSVTTTNSTTIAVGVTWISGGSNMMGANLADFYSSYFKFTTNQPVPQWINANAASGGSSSNSFANIAVSGQTTVVADSSTDTLTLVAGSGISITTDAGADSVTITATGGGGSSNSFANIAVSGQSNVVADSSTDILTLAAGSGISITTDAGSDTITIAASGGGSVAIDANNNFLVGTGTLPNISIGTGTNFSGHNIISVGNNNLSAEPVQGSGFITNNGSGYSDNYYTSITLTLFSGPAPTIGYPTVDIQIDSTYGSFLAGEYLASTYGISSTTILTADFGGGTGIQISWPLLSPNGTTVIGSGCQNLTVGILNMSLGTIIPDTYAAISNLYNCTSGERNLAVGPNGVFSQLTTGRDNIGLGPLAGQGVTTGSNNILIGADTAGGATQLATGSSNTIIGVGAGAEMGTASYNNTLLGRGAGNGIAMSNNNLVLGYNASVSTSGASNQVVLGNGSISVLRCQQTSITALSDARDKTDIESLTIGLDLLKTIRPVNFTWNTRDGARVGIKETGFIAQELKTAVDASPLKDYLASIVISNDDGSRLEAAPNKLFPVMVKAIQELSEQNAALLARLDALETLINKGTV